MSCTWRTVPAADATRARLAAIVDSSDDAIFILALDDSILTWNAGAERLYGYTASEMIGKRRALLVPDGKHDELAAIMERAARGEAGVPFETQRLRKDRSIVDVSVVISPMTDPAGSVDGDSRFCELLLPDFDPADRRHADIAEIQKAGMRAARLTRQLLAFSRKEVVEPKLLDLNAIVADIRLLLDRLIGEDVQVVLGTGDALAPVLCDQGQVEQIIVNLAVNARDAMPSGGTLTIETANVTFDADAASTPAGLKAGRYVALTVTDTGTGMSPEVRARLFEPVFTTKGVGKAPGSASRPSTASSRGAAAV